MMKEMGINFSPKRNLNHGKQMQKNSKGFMARNDKYVLNKKHKLLLEAPSNLKECTFSPITHRFKYYFTIETTK